MYNVMLCAFFCDLLFSFNLFPGFSHVSVVPSLSLLYFMAQRCQISPFCYWTFGLYLVFLLPQTVQLCAFMFLSPGVKLYSKGSRICHGLMLL